VRTGHKKALLRGIYRSWMVFVTPKSLDASFNGLRCVILLKLIWTTLFARFDSSLPCCFFLIGVLYIHRNDEVIQGTFSSSHLRTFLVRKFECHARKYSSHDHNYAPSAGGNRPVAEVMQASPPKHFSTIGGVCICNMEVSR